ncbi:DUF2267 domain-containing protein [Streptomyces sp. NPDC002845]
MTRIDTGPPPSQAPAQALLPGSGCSYEQHRVGGSVWRPCLPLGTGVCEVYAMTFREFLAAVREQGEYGDTPEVLSVTEAVLSTLGERLQPSAANHLADQLPIELAEVLMDAANDYPGGNWGVQEFVRRVAQATGDDEETSHAHAEAVLTVLAQTVSGGELNKLISQLPAGYAELFGHTELT